MDWQPIETAPKDREIFLWYPARDDGSPAGFSQGRWCDAVINGEVKGFAWMDAAYVNHHPTHWMPLPEPPSSSGDK
jgi:hypothetical protein